MNPERANNKGDDDRLIEELVCELKLLRTIVREVGESFILRREGEIEAILSHVESMPRRAVRREASQMLRELHRLDLKPRKGRFKDLKEIHRLVEEFMEALVELQGDECRHDARHKRQSVAFPEPIRAGLAGEEAS